MERIKFYSVSERYLDYLRKYEFRIPNIKYEHREKFVSGVIFEIDDMKYYAPVSSFNKQQATNYLIKFGEYPVGSIRFSFMFPVPATEIQLKDFTGDDIQYRRLVEREIQVINKNRSAIRNKAEHVYNIRIAGKNATFNQVCCDFKMLEERCRQFEKNKNKTKELEEELTKV